MLEDSFPFLQNEVAPRSVFLPMFVSKLTSWCITKKESVPHHLKSVAEGGQQTVLTRGTKSKSGSKSGLNAAQRALWCTAEVPNDGVYIGGRTMVERCRTKHSAWWWTIEVPP